MGILEIREKFKALIDKRDQADKLTLELMCNPNVRDVGDKLMDVCDIKHEIHERLCDAVTALRRKYPNTASLLHPWNRAEYNMYERYKEYEETNKC